jgi:hypothetical protein
MNIIIPKDIDLQLNCFFDRQKISLPGKGPYITSEDLEAWFPGWSSGWFNKHSSDMLKSSLTLTGYKDLPSYFVEAQYGCINSVDRLWGCTLRIKKLEKSNE